MIFYTANGDSWAVDFNERRAYGPRRTIDFDLLHGAYENSPHVKFYKGTAKDREKIHQTGLVTKVEGSPLDKDYGAEFTTFKTKSSLYEVDLKGKRLRRLAGFNPTEMDRPDGEWRTFELSTELHDGLPFGVQWSFGDCLNTSYVREIVTPHTRSLEKAA